VGTESSRKGARRGTARNKSWSGSLRAPAARQALLRTGIIKKVARSIQIQRHSSSPTGLSGGCAKPIFDHGHEKSAKRQGERGLMLRLWSSNPLYRSRREEFRRRQRRKKFVGCAQLQGLAEPFLVNQPSIRSTAMIRRQRPESSRLFDRHVLSLDLAPRLLELGSHLTRCWSKTDSNPRSLSRKCRPLRPKGKCRSAQKGRPREGLPGTIPWLRGNISYHASDRAVLLSTTTLKVEIGAQPTASISPVTEGG
jgi:hypothetical protein